LVIGKQSVFHKLRVFIEQNPQPLATEQLSFSGIFFVILVRASVLGFGLRGMESLDGIGWNGLMRRHGPA
jgi:hypothetical protein